jgi:hypothetical protein
MEKSNFNKPEQAKIMYSFEGIIRRRGITPTDIDGFIEYGGELFIFFEGKCEGVTMLEGQKSAYKSLIDIIGRGGGLAFCFTFEHERLENIIVKDQIVRKVYSTLPNETDFRFTCGKFTVLEAIERCEKYYDRWRKNKLTI